jgi:hypothetical protein
MPLPSPSQAKHIFERLAISGKLGLVLTLFLLALVNGDTKHVSRKPRLFLLDAVFTALAGGAAAAFLCKTRGRMDAALSHTMLATLFFFMFAVCREFSGYFSLLSGSDLSSREGWQRALAKKPVTYFVGACGLVAVGLAALAHVAPPMGTSDFLQEALVFAGLISLADAWCAYTHAQAVGSALFMGIGMYGVLHMVLQFGGMYEHLYGGFAS